MGLSYDGGSTPPCLPPISCSKSGGHRPVDRFDSCIEQYCSEGNDQSFQNKHCATMISRRGIPRLRDGKSISGAYNVPTLGAVLENQSSA